MHFSPLSKGITISDTLYYQAARGMEVMPLSLPLPLALLADNRAKQKGSQHTQHKQSQLALKTNSVSF